MLLLCKYINCNSHKRLQQPWATSGITDRARLFKHWLSFGIGWSLNASAISRLIQLPKGSWRDCLILPQFLLKERQWLPLIFRTVLHSADPCTPIPSIRTLAKCLVHGEWVGRTVPPIQPEETAGLPWTIIKNCENNDFLKQHLSTTAVLNFC